MAAFNGAENEKVFISQELYERLGAQSGVPQKGDVMVTGGGSVGTPYIVPDDKPLYTKDADLIWIKRHAEIDPKFLYSFFVSPIFKSYIQSISHVGTIAHYTIEQVKETPLSMPWSIVEQKAVGSFFGNLDSLITLHQRMCPIFSFCAHGSRTNFAQTLQGWLQILRYPRPIPKMLVSPSAPASGVFGTAKGAFICASSSAGASTSSPSARKNFITSSTLCCRESLSSP